MKVLHLLQWNIQDIIQKLNRIKEQGFDTIQISPIQGTKENNIESHDDYLTFGYTKKLTEELINEEYFRLCKTYKNTLYYVRPFSTSWEKEIVKNANKIRI